MSCDSTTSTCVTLCTDDTGCPLQLDFDCVFYHKSNSEVSNLTKLGITNGATLGLFAETVDTYIGQIKVSEYVIPGLTAEYTINTLKQFAEAVDDELTQIKSDITAISSSAAIPISKTDSATVAITISGTGSHTIKSDVKVSATASNLLSALSDGLYVTPQTLNLDYSTKELSISNGNSFNLAPLISGVGGFLGNLTSDPTGIVDGQYWYNTTSSQLKIKVNGVTKVITTT
jgi:hypothetical protein